MPHDTDPARMAGAGGAAAATRGSEPMVRFEGVTKRYGSLVVLDDLNLDIAPNEKVSIIGPSGSGKTTVLRMLMTLERIDGGVIWVDGHPLTHMEKGGRLVPADERHRRRVRANIGMVFQQFNLFPHMTALGNCIEAPIHVLGLSREEAEARATELLAMVGLSDKRNHYPSQLSGGQQQLVAVARAIIAEPAMILADEPTGSLHSSQGRMIMDLLKDLNREGTTIIQVTHNEEYARYGDRIIELRDGWIVDES